MDATNLTPRRDNNAPRYIKTMSEDLFGTFFNYDFPIPQYLGSKYIHKEWIGQFVPTTVCAILDAFAGSQTIAFMMKQLGKRVITNDFMNFSAQIGKALIENHSVTLDKSDIDVLFSSNKDPENYSLMERLYSDLFFSHEEACFLDAFRSNVSLLDNAFKQALALSIMCRSMTRKVTMGHFAHTRALDYANNPERIKRNRSLIRPLRDLFLELLPLYNAAVFDNKEENVSYNENILELLPKLNNIDLVYFDPPYCNSHADYQSFYHLLETFVEYWKDKQFVNGIKRYEPKRYSGFDKNTEALNNLKKLFERSNNIPYWLVSYNDRSYPDIETMLSLLKNYRNVRVERKQYQASRGGKGSVAGCNEVLFLCSN